MYTSLLKNEYLWTQPTKVDLLMCDMTINVTSYTQNCIIDWSIWKGGGGGTSCYNVIKFSNYNYVFFVVELYIGAFFHY